MQADVYDLTRQAFFYWRFWQTNAGNEITFLLDIITEICIPEFFAKCKGKHVFWILKLFISNSSSSSLFMLLSV